MGYEYEIDSDDYGPPAVSNWTPVGHYDFDSALYVKRPPKNPKCPIKDLPPHFMVRYESTGMSNGYEIKSAIAPLMIHKIIIRRLFKMVTFNDHPSGDKNDGGIHVSVSRDKNTEPHHRKVFTFLHQTMNREHQVKLSERKQHLLDEYAQQTIEKNDTRVQHWQLTWDHHYSIINKENHNRYEFRMFAAQKHLLLPALEMADSLFNLARETDAITMEGWTQYIRSKVKYTHIAQHVRKRLS